MDRNFKAALVLVTVGVLICTGIALFVLANSHDGEKPGDPYAEVTDCYYYFGETRVTVECYNFSDVHKNYEILVYYYEGGEWHLGNTENCKGGMEQGEELSIWIPDLRGREIPIYNIMANVIVTDLDYSDFQDCLIFTGDAISPRRI